jgi:hypothetical protein
MTKEVEAYLINEQGYTKSEISEIYTEIGKAPMVSTTVIFKDEQGSRYFKPPLNKPMYLDFMRPINQFIYRSSCSDWNI